MFQWTVILLLLLSSHPNLKLTPGVVNTKLTLKDICGTKWGKDHRLVTTFMKKQVFKSYKINWSERTKYKVDHLIPRELGGADDIKNLWPQPWLDATIKDKEENRLHKAVCNSGYSLDAARNIMIRWGQK